MLKQLRALAKQHAFEVEIAGQKGILLYASFSDGKQRAHAYHFFGPDFAAAWAEVEDSLASWAQKHGAQPVWIRIDWGRVVRAASLAQINTWLQDVKRNYMRWGLILGSRQQYAFTEQELNANAMLYRGVRIPHAQINENNFLVYGRKKYPDFDFDFNPQQTVYMVDTAGAFISADEGPYLLYRRGRNAGRRVVKYLDEENVTHLITTASEYLISQVKDSGRFIYGWHPCFGREIRFYNTLRHASTVYSMVEAWEVTRSPQLKAAIDKALQYLLSTYVKYAETPDGQKKAYLVEEGFQEIKLGANGVLLLALTKYTQVFDDKSYLPVAEALALGIQVMQDPETGGFVHILNYPDLTLKERFRVVYYDGEAAFGLMRLYGITRDARWLAIVEKAFGYFIANDYWKNHDHWLSYCVNELTTYKEKEEYYRFGIQNVAGYLDFVADRITTFPTLLELMMAAEQMVKRLQLSAQYGFLLDELDLRKFYAALEKRAMYLLNGYFAPEIAMYFADPQCILGGFFIRHHSFRVRIDDVEHYLSGYVAYLRYLQRKNSGPRAQARSEKDKNAVRLIWGGDVNLARRQHYRTTLLGVENVLQIPAFKEADYRVINLECVISTLGKQGFDKGEGGPYYYRARPEMIDVLLAADVDMVATANNHAGDYGAEALLQQKQLLDSVGIESIGSGINFSDALCPRIITLKEVNIALFNIDMTAPYFGATTNKAGIVHFNINDKEKLRKELGRAIDEAREHSHVVLVAVHFGNNQLDKPTNQEKDIARFLIDLGVDAVLGTSAHVLQGIEVYKNRPIIYDAGDLLFDAVRKRPKLGGVFQLIIKQEGIARLDFIPIAVGFGQSWQLHGRQAYIALDEFARLCKELGTTLNKKQGGIGSLDLSLTERALQKKALISSGNRIKSLQLDKEFTLPERWLVNHVPNNAKINPVHLGPLTLLGVQVTPTRFESRGMLWVESFWRLREPTDEDYRIYFLGEPLEGARMRPWGYGMDHDPCDWLYPTSRWKLGNIYRDFYGLRPPSYKDWENVPLQLTVGLVTNQSFTKRIKLPVQVELAYKNKVQRKSSLPTTYQTNFPEMFFDSTKQNQTWNAEQLALITGGRWLTPPPRGWFVNSVIMGPAFLNQAKAPILFVGHDSYDRERHEQTGTKIVRNFDRHKILPSLVNKLAGAIVSKPVSELPDNFPQLLVRDPVRCYIELGLAARQRFKGPVIAITGSVGKSSTTHMFEQVCQKIGYAVLATSENYNSRVGALGTLASLGPFYQAAVVEVAQSALWMKRGPVTQWLKPAVSVLLSVSPAHMIKHSSLEKMALYKAKIFEGGKDGDKAVINRDIDFYDQIENIALKNKREVITYGEHVKAAFRVTGYEANGFRFVFSNKEYLVKQRSIGKHFSLNLLAIVATFHALGLPWQNFLAEIGQHAQSLQGRGNIIEYSLSDGSKAYFIDQSYNATPESVISSLNMLKDYPSDGRKVAVLSDMLELGKKSDYYHTKIANYIEKLELDMVLTYGDLISKSVSKSTIKNHFSFSSLKELFSYLKEHLLSDDVVMVKGSNSTGLNAALRKFAA